MKTTKTIISKSAKRKMSSSVKSPETGEITYRPKANDFTQEVVYKTYLGHGRFASETRHEKI